MTHRALLFLLTYSVAMQPHHEGGAVPLDSTVVETGDSTSAVFHSTRYLPTLLATTTIRPAGELRALWVVRDALRSPQAVERMIDFAHEARFHLLFVQVRGRGDAFYHSATEPPGGELEFPIEEFDPLEYVLILARRWGISVHAWLNVYYVWSNPTAAPPSGHVFHEHPEWFLADPGGTRMSERTVKWWQQDGIEGYYLAPGSRQVRAHFASIVQELVAGYGVDGIHLDYVRYPGRVYGFDPSGRTDFALRWGVDPVMLGPQRDELVREIGADAVSAMDSIYTEWRVASVDSLVLAVRDIIGDLPLSAAVTPDPQAARYHKGQDWARWTQRRWMDFVVPMAYNYRPAEARNRIRAMHNTIGHDRVLVGLALHDGRSLFLPQTITELREEQTIGYSIFSYNVLADMRFPARLIEEAFFPAVTDSL